MKPPKQFGLEPNVVLKLIKPPYGLVDTVDYWYLTMRAFMREKLSMETFDADIALYFERCADELIKLPVNKKFQNFGPVRNCA